MKPRLKCSTSIAGALLLLLFCSSRSYAQQDVDLKCDFQNRACQWDTPRGGIQWRWATEQQDGLQLDGPNDSLYSGIPFFTPLDLKFLLIRLLKSLGSLSYLMINFTAGSLAQSQILTSTFVTAPADAYCFTFAYYVLVDQSKDSGLRLFLETSQGTLNSSEIWYSAGVNYDRWESTMLNLRGVKGQTFRVSSDNPK